MGVAIGKLRERIEIIAYSGSSKDEYGQPIRSPYTYATLWASYRSLNGSEVVESKERTARRFAEFKIRAQGVTIVETMEVIYKGMTFSITSVAEDEYQDYITINGVSKDNDNV
jgi:SPP1 family predicted phage head-tail adaptor